MGVEIFLRLPVLVKHEQPRIVGRDMEVVVEAALLGAGRGADREKRLAHSLLLAGLGPVIGDHGDPSRHVSALNGLKIAGSEWS
jgi:hypothetical protein